MHTFVVVGAGTAGCIVAARLTEAGESVVLIEAGPDYGELVASWPPELLDSASLPTSHDWGYSGEVTGGRTLPYERARVMGGCSSHNGCTQSAGWWEDYDTWPQVNDVGWSAEELKPIFSRVADRMAFSCYKNESIQPFHHAFLTGCVAAGLDVTNDFADLHGGEGAGCPPVNILDGVRMNTCLAYINPVRHLPNLRIISDAEVNRVLLDDGRATRVEYVQGAELRTLMADEIVLAAGAYGTPAILQRSGIGDPELLAGIGIEVLSELEGVGRNLHDHPAAQIEISGTPLLDSRLREFEARQLLPEEQSVAKIRSPQATGPYDLHVYPWVEPVSRNAWKCVFPVGLLTPKSRGTVTITSHDTLSRPVIDSNFFSDPHDADIAAVRFGVRWADGILRSGAFDGMLGRALSAPPCEASDAQLNAWIRSNHSHYWHPAGSCRMGDAADPLSVVDYAGRVLGVDSLRITDASIFPEIPRSTPAWPTAVTGERIADLILSGL